MAATVARYEAELSNASAARRSVHKKITAKRSSLSVNMTPRKPSCSRNIGNDRSIANERYSSTRVGSTLVVQMRTITLSLPIYRRRLRQRKEPLGNDAPRGEISLRGALLSQARTSSAFSSGGKTG